MFMMLVFKNGADQSSLDYTGAFPGLSRSVAQRTCRSNFSMWLYDKLAITQIIDPIKFEPTWRLARVGIMVDASRVKLQGVQRHFSFPMKTQIFFFSVFRVVQYEAKTPKLMGCCRANFAFLRALKIGTFREKWTYYIEWAFKTSCFVRLAIRHWYNMLA